MAEDTAKFEETAPAAPVVENVLPEAPAEAVAAAEPVTTADPAPAAEPLEAATKPETVADVPSVRKPRKTKAAVEQPAAPAPKLRGRRPTKVKAAKAALPKVVAPKAGLPKAVSPKAPSPKNVPTELTAKAPVRKVRLAAQSKLKTVPSSTPLSNGTRKPGKPAASIKEMTMAKTTPTDFLASFQNVFGDMQTKAAGAYEKSTAALAEANDFTKGNVEAVVESGKILASGLQDLGATMVSESRSVFDALTSEMKDLASVKNPSEFLSMQSTLARKNFDVAVATASKNTEAMLKLMTDVFTPLSSRMTLAVEKVSKAA